MILYCPHEPSKCYGQTLYRALAQNIAQHDAYEILTPIGLVPHPLISSVWAANPSGKSSKS